MINKGLSNLQPADLAMLDSDCTIYFDTIPGYKTYQFELTMVTTEGKEIIVKDSVEFRPNLPEDSDE